MARVMVYDIHRIYDDADLQASKVLGDKIIKNYKLSAEYAGSTIPDGIMKTTPAWLFNDRNIDEVASSFKEALSYCTNPNLRFRITKKSSKTFSDHLGRESWEVIEKIVVEG